MIFGIDAALRLLRACDTSTGSIAIGRSVSEYSSRFRMCVDGSAPERDPLAGGGGNSDAGGGGQ